MQQPEKPAIDVPKETRKPIGAFLRAMGKGRLNPQITQELTGSLLRSGRGQDWVNSKLRQVINYGNWMRQRKSK